MKGASCLLLAAFAGLTPVLAQQMDGLVIEFPESNPVDLGYGWSTRGSQKVSRVCIDFVAAERKYQDRRLSFEVVSDNQSLANALKVSVSAKFKAVTGGGGSVAVDFARNAKLSSASTNIAVLAEVFESPTYVSPTDSHPAGQVPIAPTSGGKIDLSSFYAGHAVSLKADLRSIAATNPAEFYRQCGDSFVAVIHRGARLVGNMTFAETTREERESLEVTASGGAAMWSVQGSLATSMEKYSSSNRLNVNFIQLGGSGGQLPLNRDGLLKAIEQLPEASKAAPKPFSMIVQRYDTLPSWPSAVGAAELTDLEVIANVAWQLDSLLAYVDETLYRPGWLLKFDTRKEDIQKVYDDILSDRSRIRADATLCASGGECNRKKWQGWSDLSYRTRLPFRGGIGDLSYPVGANAIEGLIDALVSARASYWIEGPARIRCRNEGICVSQAQITAARNQIRSRIQASIL